MATLDPSAAAGVPPAPPLMPTIVGLLVVLALVPLAVWLLRRLRVGGAAPAGGLRVVAQLALGPRERVVVVEAGDRCLVLGVSGAGIQRLGTLSRDALPPAATTPLPFVALLRSRLANHARD